MPPCILETVYLHEPVNSVSCHVEGDLLLAECFFLPEKYISGEREFEERWMRHFFFCDGTRLLVLGRTLLVFLANTTYIHNNTGICDESSECRGCAWGRCKLLRQEG